MFRSLELKQGPQNKQAIKQTPLKSSKCLRLGLQTRPPARTVAHLHLKHSKWRRDYRTSSFATHVKSGSKERTVTLRRSTERSPLRMHSLSPVPSTITSYSSSMAKVANKQVKHNSVRRKCTMWRVRRAAGGRQTRGSRQSKPEIKAQPLQHPEAPHCRSRIDRCVDDDDDDDLDDRREGDDRMDEEIWASTKIGGIRW